MLKNRLKYFFVCVCILGWVQVSWGQASYPSGIASATSRSDAQKTSSTGAAMTPTSANQPAYNYTSDEETEMISSAVSAYNLENPNFPIKEITAGILEKLVSGGYLKEVLKNTNNLVLRDGKVFRKEKAELKDASSGASGESFKGIVEGTAKILSDQSPKGNGNPTPDASFKMDKQTISIKVNGQYKDVPMVVPHLPKIDPLKTPQGTAVESRETILQKMIYHKRARLNAPNRKIKRAQTPKTPEVKPKEPVPIPAATPPSTPTPSY